MCWASQCAVVVPCLNEARAIGPLVSSICATLPVVIVVDDGSTDATESQAKAAGASVIRHETPRGKGAALIAGMTHAHSRGFTHALTMDGDGQHAPSDIAEFLSRAGESDAPLIVGNRMGRARAMPWLRRQVNRWMSRKLSRLTGRDLPDSQCGFRLVRLAEWSVLAFHTRHFDYESEMLCAFAARGHAIEFVPIQTIYRAEASKIHPWRDTVRWFRWLSSLRGTVTIAQSPPTVAAQVRPQRQPASAR